LLSTTLVLWWMAMAGVVHANFVVCKRLDVVCQTFGLPGKKCVRDWDHAISDHADECSALAETFMIASCVVASSECRFLMLFHSSSGLQKLGLLDDSVRRVACDVASNVVSLLDLEPASRLDMILINCLVKPGQKKQQLSAHEIAALFGVAGELLRLQCVLAFFLQLATDDASESRGVVKVLISRGSVYIGSTVGERSRGGKYYRPQLTRVESLSERNPPDP
jgi:hypothetical protein